MSRGPRIAPRLDERDGDRGRARPVHYLQQADCSGKEDARPFFTKPMGKPVTDLGLETALSS